MQVVDLACTVNFLVSWRLCKLLLLRLSSCYLDVRFQAASWMPFAVFEVTYPALEPSGVKNHFVVWNARLQQKGRLSGLSEVQEISWKKIYIEQTQ